MSARAQVGVTLLMAGALLLTSVPAFPAGIELAWNHCYGQAGAQSMRTSACVTNTGSQTMVASFRPRAGVTKLEGIEVVIEYQVLGGLLPCWWRFEPGQLRSEQLIPLPVSPTDANGSPLITCDNHYFLDRGAVGEGGMTVLGPDCARIRGSAALLAGTGLPVPEDAQQYGVGLRIANDNTVPAAACPGCLVAACFLLDNIKLYSPGSPDVILSAPHPGSENWITWQGTSVSTGCPFICGRSVPVLQSTWGAIKSIYR